MTRRSSIVLPGAPDGEAYGLGGRCKNVTRQVRMAGPGPAAIKRACVRAIKRKLDGRAWDGVLKLSIQELKGASVCFVKKTNKYVRVPLRLVSKTEL